MVDISDNIIQKSKDWLKKASASWKHGVCWGSAVYLDGRLTKVTESHSACHSWVYYAFGYACFGGSISYYNWDKKYPANAKNFLVLNCHPQEGKRTCSKEVADFLVLWLAKESPFSKFVLNRDDDESLTEGGLILLCGPDGLSCAQAMWLCKLTRFLTEGAQAPETFKTLVEGGVDGMLAAFVASHVRSIKGATFGYTGKEAHSTVFSTVNGGDLLGLLSRNLNPNANSTADLFVAPKGVKAGPNTTFRAGEAYVQGLCKPYSKPDGWGGTVTGKGVSGKELVENTLEWQRELQSQLSPLPPEPVPMPNENTVYLDVDL